jgi:hypothetical protein
MRRTKRKPETGRSEDIFSPAWHIKVLAVIFGLLTLGFILLRIFI